MLIDAWFLEKDMRPLSSFKHLGVAWPSVSMAKIDLSNDQQILTSFFWMIYMDDIWMIYMDDIYIYMDDISYMYVYIYI